jgi:hypothetical protein
MKMAFGGYVGSGTDLTKAPKNPVFDVRYYKNKEGATMFITHINGKPMTPVPEGFTQVTAEEAQKVGQAADEEEKKKAATGGATDQGGSDAIPRDPKVTAWLEEEERLQKIAEAEGRKGPRDLRMEKIGSILEKITGTLLFVGAAKKGASLLSKYLPSAQPTTSPLLGADGSMMQAAAADAFAAAKAAGATDAAATQAAARTVEYMQSGSDAYSAYSRATEETKQAEAVTKAAEESYMYGNYSPTSPSTPSTGATASPVTSTGGGIASRDISAELNVGSGDSSIGTSDYTSPKAIGQDVGESYSFLAKGGLVSKRQYPAKKKKGKGIAASK